MNEYSSYRTAEDQLLDRIMEFPDFVTKTMHERIMDGFILMDPSDNENTRSNYTYAEKFFEWLITGKKELSTELVDLNPWVKRFVDTAGLPDNFSASYGWKIKEQLDVIMTELVTHSESRRGYVPILHPQDQVILSVKTTHEYPCTIGFQFLIRENHLNMVVNMRSNNCLSVMPYDVYNFTRLQLYVAQMLGLRVSRYFHQINSAHIYNGDVRRLRESKTIIK